MITYFEHTVNYNLTCTLNEHMQLISACTDPWIQPIIPHLIRIFHPSLKVPSSLHVFTSFHLPSALPAQQRREEQRSLTPQVWMCLWESKREGERLLYAERGREWWHVSSVPHYERDFVVCDCIAVCVIACLQSDTLQLSKWEKKCVCLDTSFNSCHFNSHTAITLAARRHTHCHSQSC